MTTQRITNSQNQLVGYVEERRETRQLELLDGMRRKLGSFLPDTASTVDADGGVVGSGNKLLSLLRTTDALLRVEPEAED